jgi:polar amino acid transport system substrate-binding protein
LLKNLATAILRAAFISLVYFMAISRLFSVILVLVFWLAPFSCFANDQKTVRLFLQESLDVEGKQVPLDPKLLEILSYLERETGLKFEPIILPWKRAQFETLEGKGIIYGFSRSPERVKLYFFSVPLITEKVWGISYGSPKPHYKTVQDLRGKIVSTGRGFSHGMEFDQARDVIFKVQEDSASTIARFKKLVAKRSDLMVWPVRGYQRHNEVEEYINQVIIKNSNDPELQGKHFDISDQPLFYDTTHFASVKGKYEDVIAKIDKAIKRGTKNGSLVKVLRGYH